MSMKRYGGAPFGIQTARFDISGVHPKSKMPGTYTQVPYCHRATTAECRSLAPGAYDIAVGGFSDREVLRRSQGPGWRRAQEVARLAGIPHMLYKEQWNHKKFLRESLGPGRYTMKDFMQLEQSRPSSHRGVCQSTGPRLAVENKLIASLPGPGSYGKGGIPSQVVEETAKRSPGVVGMLDCGGNNVRTQLTVGSHLAPGQYTSKGSINQLLDKTTGKRGPYDLSSGDRSKSARAAKNRHLGPGTYKIPSSLDEWRDRHHRMHGRFPQDVQYPSRPSERMYCSTLSQWPRGKYDPGPGHYTRIKTAPPAGSVSSHRNNNRVSFGYSSERFNRQSQQNFSGVTNSVAVGQYSLIRWDHSQHRNGNVSIFQSATPRLPIKVNSSREQLISERLHPKHPVRGPHTIMKTAIRQPVEAPC